MPVVTPSGFVRRDDAALVVVNVLAAARSERWHIGTDEKDRRAGRAEVLRLLCNLGDGGTLRALEVANWYLAWCEANFSEGKSLNKDPREKFMPAVHVGRSFREKFGPLEDALKRLQPKRAPTPDEVLAGAFNGHAALANTFRRDVLVPAEGLDFGSVSDGELALALTDLYADVSSAHVIGAPLGPITFLSRYVDWLGEKTDWRMTTRVLSIGSPALQQFRREEASLHPRGADPLTGR